MEESEALEHSVAMTRWELDQTLEWLTKQKFSIDQEEERILTRRYRDRLKKMIEPTLPGIET